MLTKLGIKLLDFGLAKRLADGTDSDSSDAPTQTKQKDLTADQAVVGTLQYMAPEQLEAKAADARTDIFAFGAMLYDVERESLARRTLDAISAYPIWTPDGARLTYTSWTGSWHFFWKLAEGGENREQLLAQYEFPRARSWSPDGTRLAFQKYYPETRQDIWIFVARYSPLS